MRRGNVRAAVKSHVSVAHVVADNEQDIWRRRDCARALSARRENRCGHRTRYYVLAADIHLRVAPAAKVAVNWHCGLSPVAWPAPPSLRPVGSAPSGDLT